MTTASSPSRVYPPASSTTGSYQISWHRIYTAGTIYEVEVDSGSGFVPLTSTANAYLTLSGQGTGTYTYPVRSASPGYEPSSWTATPPVAVTLTCAKPSGVYGPVSSTTGEYTISWGFSTTPGVLYDVEINDGSGFKYLTTISNGYLIAKMPNGTYQYRVKAIRNSYVDSEWQAGAPFTVTLTSATPSGIYGSTPSTTGGYTISWSKSTTPGVTYVLEESTDGTWTAPNVYPVSTCYKTFTGKTNGAYQYRVKAIRTADGYVDSSCKTGTPVVVP